MRLTKKALGQASTAVALMLALPAVAQTTDKPTAPATDSITVTGQRMPRAEAPKSATCEALAEDPHVAAQLLVAAQTGTLGPQILLPTRTPRNPDYSKPPAVAPGSPLPDLGKARFGDSYREDDPQVANLVAEPPAGFGELADGTIPPTASEAAASICRSNHSASRGGARPRSIASNDSTLPMAFALFDQGRYEESLEWFKKAERRLQTVEGGDEASLFIGKLYLQGLGARSDPAEAVRWLKKTATLPFNPTKDMPVFDPLQPERNTAIGEAATILGNLYRTGAFGVTRDAAEARKWFDKAWDVGHVTAGKIIGDLYLEGFGTPRNVKRAADWYRKAARFDLAAAQVALAAILWDGLDDVPQDRREALGWYKQAALSNHPAALYAIARAYDLGLEVKADPALAIGFYKVAALNGSAQAQTALGIYFFEGGQVPQDLTTARRWFEAAAKAGDPDGMVNLAAMQIAGQGGPRDRIAAWRWLKRASSLGHPKAGSAAAALEKLLTPQEREATSR